MTFLGILLSLFRLLARWISILPKDLLREKLYKPIFEIVELALTSLMPQKVLTIYRFNVHVLEFSVWLYRECILD